MTNQELKETLDQDLHVVTQYLLAAFGFGILAILLRYLILLASGLIHRLWEGTGLAFVSFLWALAWLVTGFLFGFVFGIPKVLKPDTTGSGAASAGAGTGASPSLKVNTNLEDISDWLTKILVGATLTQLIKVPGAVKKAAWFMSKGDASSSAVSFNAALLLYFAVLGFLSGYLMTRMFFAVAFARADGAPDHWGAILSPLGSAPAALGDSGPSTDPLVQSAAVASQNIPLTPSLSTAEAVAVATGATRAGDAERALKASTLAVQQNPNDPSAQLSYAVALHSMGVSSSRTLASVEAAAAKTTSSSDPGLLTSVYTSLTYLYLYEPPPDGFQHAIEAAAVYDSKGGKPNASIEINRACAYGQKVKYLQGSGKGQEQVQSARDAALAAVKKALDLQPSSASRLSQLLWVTGSPDDDDLAVFQSDNDFTTLLPKPAAQ